MVQGGAVGTGNSEYFAQGVLEIIQGSEALQAEGKNFLNQDENLRTCLEKI